MGDDKRLSALAARQHGLFTSKQALRAEFSASLIRRRVERGQWVQLDRGVYHVRGAPFTWETRVLACCLAGRAVASHRTAAVLWGIEGFRRGRPEVVIPRGRKFRRSGVRVHEIRDFDLREEMRIVGIPTVGIDVVLFQLGAVVGYQEQRSAVESALRQQLTTWPRIYRILSLHRRRGRRGSRQLAKLMDEAYGTRVPESSWSRLVADLLVDAGLPAPLLEYEVTTPEGEFLAWVDLAWPTVKFAVELQSRAWHLHGDAFESDPVRRNALQRWGWDVFDYTWRYYVEHPAEICREVAEHLRLRGHVGVRGAAA